MRKLILCLLLLIANLSAVQKMPSSYLVTFGEEDASFEIVQFYSLSCPHCVQIFNHDFPLIQKEFIKKGRLRYVFHPAPMDLTTVQFMCCLEKLDEKKKQLLLSVLLEELSLDNPEFNIVLMKKAMELLGCPIEELDQDTFIKSSRAFEMASDFVLQEGAIKAIPSVQIGDKVIEKVPDYPFVFTIMNRFFSEDSDYVH